jgi:hypothetical protein
MSAALVSPPAIDSDRRVLRSIIFFALILSVAPTAGAAKLPRIDVKQHCAEMTGNRQNWVRCMGAENQARAWLGKRQIDSRLIQDCWEAQRSAGGYVVLRACIEAKLGQ